MKIDDQMIEKISGLACLEFGEDTKDVEPLVYLSERTDVLREDRVVSSISHEEALLNAPGKSGRFFKVPKVIRK